jgi:hypothetical protein
MKLTHLGNQYTRVETDIETIETNTELRFLGQSFKMRAPKATACKFPAGYLVYRGARYKA